MADTTIEWTRGDDGTPGAAWNPTSGCDKVSPGCGLPRWPGDDTGGCYAMAMAKRLKAMGQAKYQTDGDPRTSGPGFGLAVHPDALDIPLRWRKPRRIFVNSMSDLFHADVPDEFVAKVFAVMASTPRHTYQLLTKRHARMRSLLGSDKFRQSVQRRIPHVPAGKYGHRHYREWPLPNLWVGVSVEDQQWADIRIPALLDTPAAVRWISAEPLLGPVDLTQVAPGTVYANCGFNAFAGAPDSPALSWVVCGGESGPGARPMHPQWVQTLRDQCQAAGVPFFLKQWGEWVYRDQMPEETYVQLDQAINLAQAHPEPFRVGKKRAGRLLDGREWNEYPEVSR